MSVCWSLCYEHRRGSQIPEDQGTLGKAGTKPLLETWLLGDTETLKKEVGWTLAARDGSVVKSASFRFGCQHPHGSSRATVAPVPGGLASSLASAGLLHANGTYKSCKHIHMHIKIMNEILRRVYGRFW